MAIEVLKPLQIFKASSGYHSDGGGLFLCVRGSSSTWVYRYTAPTGKQRYMGLGTAERSSIAVAAESLARARKNAAEARELRRKGLDPIDHARAEKLRIKTQAIAAKQAQKSAQVTLARAARAYHERVIEPKARNAKHSLQWIASLERHVPESIWHKPIGAVTHGELFGFLDPLMRQIPETASRIHQRLEVVFNDAVFHGHAATNPATVIQQKLFKENKRVEVESHTSLPWAECPAFVKNLRQREENAARALEFLILTASRTGEVIGARWSEFDFNACLWTIPKERMKAGKQHIVYLVPRALEILHWMKEQDDTFVFPSPGKRKPLSNMAMLALLQRRMNVDATVHGFRASFSTWSNEHHYRPDVIERTLAHVEQNDVRRAYDRSDHAEARRQLLSDWAEFLEGKTHRDAANDAGDLKAA